MREVRNNVETVIPEADLDPIRKAIKDGIDDDTLIQMLWDATVKNHPDKTLQGSKLKTFDRVTVGNVRT